MAASGGLLSACSSSTTDSSNGGGKPKKGGTLRVAAQGGASTDTLDPHVPLTNADNARVAQLYDQLVSLGDDGIPKLVIAESMEPSKDATSWTIKIREGVKFHDGRTLTSKDILANFRRIYDGKMSGKQALGPIDLKKSKVLDPTTLRLEFEKPYGLLMEAISVYFFGIVPADFDPKKPVGTGAFKFKSFTPGTQSTFVRHAQYWNQPYPYLDAIVTQNIADETAQINGLRSGQLDIANYLSASSAGILKAAGLQTTVSKTGAWGPFTMRVDKAPFNDPKVRQALKLVVDRKEMIDSVYEGLGTIGNDVFGVYDPNYFDLPQREQDIDRAKSLLRSAGQQDLFLPLITTDNGPGQVNAAQVYATQAKAAGINVKLQKQDPTDYFANTYLKANFSQDFFPTGPYLTTVAQATTSTAAYNATHQADARYDKLFAQASVSTDDAQKKQLAHELMKYDHEYGGNIIPYFFPSIDGYAKNVHGIVESATGYSPGGFNWEKFWME